MLEAVKDTKKETEAGRRTGRKEEEKDTVLASGPSV